MVKKIVIIIFLFVLIVASNVVNVHGFNPSFSERIQELKSHEDISNYIIDNFDEFVVFHNNNSSEKLYASYVEYNCSIIIDETNESATYLDFDNQYGGMIFGDDLKVFYVDYSTDLSCLREIDSQIYFDMEYFYYIEDGIKIIINDDIVLKDTNKSMESYEVDSSITNIDEYLLDRYPEIEFTLNKSRELTFSSIYTRTQSDLSVYSTKIDEDHSLTEGNCMLVAVYNLFCYYYELGLSRFPVDEFFIYNPNIEEPELVSQLIDEYGEEYFIINTIYCPELYYEIREFAKSLGYKTSGDEMNIGDSLNFEMMCIDYIFDKYYGYMSFYWKYSSKRMLGLTLDNSVFSLIDDGQAFIFSVLLDEYYSNHSTVAYGYRQYKLVSEFLVIFERTSYLTFVKVHDGRRNDAWIDTRFTNYTHVNERDTAGYVITYAKKEIIDSGGC